MKAKYLFFAVLFVFVLAGSSFAQDKIAFTVFVNSEERGDAFARITMDGDILLKKSDIGELGLVVTGREAQYDGEIFVSLRSLFPKVTFSFEEKELALRITAVPEVFEGNSLNLQRHESKGLLYPKDDSAFLNYSLELNLSERMNFEGLTLPLEAGIRRGDYLFYSGFSYNRLKDDQKFLRLFSNIVRDDTTSLIRYTAGDFNASTGELGGGVILGGLNVSKNFNLNPYFLRYPGINLSGLLYTTSDVELWVDGMLISRQRFSPGKFEFLNIPATAGIGDAELVIRDNFGREQRMAVPFYLSSNVLKKGIYDYNYSAGFVREEMGLENFRYTKPAMTLTHRYGFSDRLTAGIRAEATRDLVSSGLSASFIIEKLGFFDASVGYSVNRGIKGEAYSLGYSYSLRKKGLSFRLLLRGHSREYSNLSLEPDQDRSRMEFMSSMNYSNIKLGNISLFYNYSNNYLSDSVKKYTARYSKTLMKNLTFDISASSTRSDRTTHEVFMAFRYIFDPLSSVSLTHMNSDGESTGNINIHRMPKNDRGLAYNLFAEKKAKTPETLDAELSYYGRYGIYSGRYRRLSKVNSFNFKTSGSVTAVRDSVHFGRPVTDSFAVIKVGGFKGVEVNQSNTPMDTTDGNGEVLLTRIGSFSSNAISINDKDLPFSYSLKSSLKRIAPLYRSGSFLDFEVEKIQSVMGNIFIRSNGVKKPAEFWRLIFNVGAEAEGSPLVSGGEFYLENIPSGAYKAMVRKEDQECSFDLVVPESSEAMVNLGEIICELQSKKASAERPRQKETVLPQKGAAVPALSNSIERSEKENTYSKEFTGHRTASDNSHDRYSVNMGVFLKKNNAILFTKKLNKQGYAAFIMKDAAVILKNQKKTAYRVLIGRFLEDKDARELAGHILDKEGIKPIIYRYSMK